MARMRHVAHALQRGRRPSTHYSKEGDQDMQDRTTAIALFDDRTEAQRAIEQLKRAGFSDKEIGVTARDADAGEKIGDSEKGGTKATEGAVAGVAAGAGVGALWGLGILAGVLPAIGPAIAGGTLAAILSSAAAGAATAGVAGALIGAGIPEEEAKYYESEFRAGRVLVTVRADGRFYEAQTILQQNGGYDMRSGLERSATAATLTDREERVYVGKRVAEEEEQVDAAIRKENMKVDRRGRTAPRSPSR
jgi:hypothetical protein